MFIVRITVIRFICILACVFLWCTAGAGQKVAQRNFLMSKLDATGFSFSQIDLKKWKESQKDLYLKKIMGLPDSIKSYYIAKADAALSFDWPTLSAYSYLQYKRNGNRIIYERALEKRALSLNSLVIGALITRDKKYLPQIVNGLWVMLEQSSWEIPAIIDLQKLGADLPDPREQIIGLISAETALNIATIGFMLYDELEEISPVINIRIKKELQDRMLIPYMRRSDFWWMGLKNQNVNNWNAWINTNVMITGVLSESAPDKLNQLLKKVFNSTDKFINQYPEDGGCDEGPAYWSIASGKLITLLKFMNSVSEGELNWKSNLLLHAMGSYIYKMHIDGDYFVNFADAAPKVIPNPGSVFEFGKMFEDDSLKIFGAYLLGLNKNRLPEVNLMDFLETSVKFNEMATTKLRPVSPDHAFLPNLEVWTARSRPGSDSGLFLAVEGGNNNQSHNHNDVGNFLLYADGRPVIIDAGVGTYTAISFSKRRYELWNMQSGWHNCPVINGTMQKDGQQFKATEIFYTGDKRQIRISMDISKAYPAKAGVKKWQRSFVLNRGTGNKGTVLLNENYELTEWGGETLINFLSYCTIKEVKKGEVLFYNEAALPVLSMNYDPIKMRLSVETKTLDDPKMISNWGQKIYRLSFVPRSNALKGNHKFEFKNISTD